MNPNIYLALYKSGYGKISISPSSVLVATISIPQPMRKVFTSGLS